MLKAILLALLSVSPGAAVTTSAALLLLLLSGVWLLARCADLKHMHYNINHFWQCFGVLVCIGVVSRATACLGLLVLHREKTL